MYKYITTTYGSEQQEKTNASAVAAAQTAHRAIGIEARKSAIEGIPQILSHHLLL